MFQNSESIRDRLGRWVLTMMHFALAIMLCITLVFTLSIEPASAVCCDYNHKNGRCEDNTRGTPWCGYGSCNAFGCNCDGGCRTGSPNVATATASDSTASDSTASDCLSSKEYFDSIDTDRLGSISLNEFNVWAGQAGKSFSDDKTVSDEFAKIDTNNSGSIEPAEFDFDLSESLDATKGAVLKTNQ